MSLLGPSLRFAFAAIRRHRGRAALTMLGIVIAVAAMSVVWSVGTGARAEVAEQYARLGANVLAVVPATAGTPARGAKAQAHLTEEDAVALAREAPLVARVAPGLRTKVHVVAADANTDTFVIGTTATYFTIKNWSMASGNMWTDADEVAKARVCVLGDAIRGRLFGQRDAVGETVRIGRLSYRVIGVAARMGRSALGLDPGNAIFMPIGAVRGRLAHVIGSSVSFLQVSAVSEEAMETARAEISDILRERHRIRGDEPPDYRVLSQIELAHSEERSYDVLTTLLASVAAISLIVGGIGVSNVMLVSIAERRREIGICLALGAESRAIATQFLIEAMVLSLLGGVGGVVLGACGSIGVAAIFSWNSYIEVAPIAIGLLASALTGLVFGFLPALRASRLDPVQALQRG